MNIDRLDGNPAGIALRTQNADDAALLLPIVPKDQTRFFSAKWDGIRLVFAEVVKRPSNAAELPGIPVDEDADDAEYVRLKAMSEADLQTEAAVRGVKWDKRASLDTMAKRVAFAGVTAPANK